MSRQSEIDNSFFNYLARNLIEQGCGTKDRFEAKFRTVTLDKDADYYLEPITYKDAE